MPIRIQAHKEKSLSIAVPETFDLIRVNTQQLAGFDHAAEEGVGDLHVHRRPHAHARGLSLAGAIAVLGRG